MRSAALDAVLSEFSTLVVPASRLERPAVPTVPFGVTAVDELTGGLPRGCLTEICGPASSGRTTLLLAALAGATQRGEVCALVDASDAFDPLSAEQAGVDLEKLLWVRCSEQRAAGIRHSEANPPQRHRGTEEIGSSGDRFIGSSQRGSDLKSKIADVARSGVRTSVVATRKEKETRFINSGMKNCGSRSVHTQMYSGMPAIPEVNVLTRPEQRYRDIDKLKQGDYREPAKIPPQSARGTEKIGSSGDRFMGSSQLGSRDFKSEIRNQKSEIEFWDLGPARRLSSVSRAELARVEQALKVTDLLLQSGGFGVIALDLGDVTVRNARRVPLTSWFRFRRAVENTATVLLVMEREAHARSCASLVLQLGHQPAASIQQPVKTNHGFARIDTDKSEIRLQNSEIEDELSLFTNDTAEQSLPPIQKPSHSELLTGLASHAEVARGECKKPAGSVRAKFTSQSAWSA